MAERLIIFISIAIGTTGIKLKKKVTDGTTITTTEYMQGFQYTNNALDFFPHTSTALSAGSGGYVKALAADLGGGTSYDFKYVFTYTDHLGNIRLKYAQDPSNNNRISILEEDHYYPYGLKHSGYNSFHQIFTTDDDGDLGPGTGIVLTPVNPFLGDSHKYKFGGKEYQTEFDVNTYDFGARNYDPALVRTFTQDPLGEAFYELSPYSFLNNNPMSNIDPTGALTLTGQAARDWFQGLKDDIASRPKKRKEEFEFEEDDDEREDWIKHKGSSKAVLADGSRRDAVDNAATVGGCPDGDCDEKKSVVWKDDASETVNAVNSTSAIAGGVVGEAAKFIYNEKGGYWMDKQGKMRSTNWGGNGSTGGKHGYARTLSNNLKSIGTGIGVLNATLTTYQYRSGQMSGGQYTAEMISSGISYYLPAWAVGWELGRLVTQIPSYQENFRQPIRSSLGLD